MIDDQIIWEEQIFYANELNIPKTKLQKLSYDGANTHRSSIRIFSENLKDGQDKIDYDIDVKYNAQ